MIERVFDFFRPERSGKFGTIFLKFLILLSILPIIGTALSGDDIPNSEIRSTLEAQNKNLVNFILGGISQWIRNEGRFYPGSFIWQYTSFYVFNQNVFVYKIFMGILFFATIFALTRFCVSTLNLPKFNSLYLILIFASTYQIQQSTSMAFDGITGFAGLPQLGIISFVVGYFILINSNSFFKYVLSSILFYISFTTYETIFLFISSLFLFTITILPPGKRKFLIFPFFLQLITILSLRFIFFPNHSEAYVVSLDWDNLISSYFSNLVSGLPGFRLFNFYSEHVTNFVLLFVFFSIALVTYLWYSSVRNNNIDQIYEYNRNRVLFLILCAVNSYLLSPVGSSLSKRWQNTTPDYHSYISVVYQYFSLGLLAAAIFTLALQKHKRTQMLVVLLFSIVYSLNLVQNFISVEALSP
jgi:hypothetical protein